MFPLILQQIALRAIGFVWNRLFTIVLTILDLLINLGLLAFQWLVLGLILVLMVKENKI